MSDTTFIDQETVVEALWLNDVNDHVYNSTPVSPAATVHPASVISNTPAGSIAATTVQAAIDEVSGDIDGHIADTTAAHTASAIANTPAGAIAATTVQAAINELDTEKAALAGSASQVFSVAAATAAAHAVRLDQVGLRVAQIVTTQTGAVATGTTDMPLDDTIPQNTEGDQYMSLAITPTNASSTLEIDVTWIGSNSAANHIIVALFQDSVADALTAADDYQSTATGLVEITFKHIMTAGTTSLTTFKVRAGGAPSGTTTTFNGQLGARRLGGVMASRITIKEYLP